MIIILILLSAIFVVFVIIFNQLIRDKNLVREAWSGIDVQLKRRFDLVPNIVEVVKGYAKYEKNVFEEITNLRSKAVSAGTTKEKEDVENKLSGAIKTLFAVSENYPDLKANRNFLDLQKNLVEIEDQLQFARRYYNGAVRNYNILIQSFPSTLVAGLFNFKAADFFEIEYATERKTPDVKLDIK